LDGSIASIISFNRELTNVPPPRIVSQSNICFPLMIFTRVGITSGGISVPETHDALAIVSGWALVVEKNFASALVSPKLCHSPSDSAGSFRPLRPQAR
jgi:hypothetical protein